MLIGLTLAAIVVLAIGFVALPVGLAMWSAYRAPVPLRPAEIAAWVADPFHLAHRAMLAAGRSGRNRNALD